MKKILLVSAAIASIGYASAATFPTNTTPAWKSYMTTGDTADIVSSPEVAAAIGGKVDATNGSLDNPNIRNGATVGTDVSAAVGLAAGAVASRTNAVRWSDMINVNDYASDGHTVCSGSGDDTAAVQAAINVAVNPLRSGHTLFIPAGAQCNISSGLTVSLTGAYPFHILTPGKHGGVFVYPDGFSGIGISVVLDYTKTLTEFTGSAFTAEGLSLISRNSGSTPTGTALQVTETAGVRNPSLSLRHTTFLGKWAVGEQLNNVNVDYNDDTTCFSFAGTCVAYDSSGPISVEHHINNLYANFINTSAGVGLSLGHTGMTASLQGFTVDNLSCTGGLTCINAIGAAHAIDQLIVRGSQINSINGIVTSGVDSLIVSSNYFLGNNTSVSASSGIRTNVTGNIFFNAGNPVDVLFTDEGSGGAGGSVISSNLFTGTINGAPIVLKGNTDYTYISGNSCYEQSKCVDVSGLNSGYTHNIIGVNSSGIGQYTPILALTDGTETNPLKIQANGEKCAKFSWDGATYPLSICVDGAGSATLNSGLGNIILSPNAEVSGYLQVDADAKFSSKVCLDASCNRYIYEDAANSKVKIGNAENGNVFSIDDTGNVIAKGTVTQNGSP